MCLITISTTMTHNAPARHVGTLAHRRSGTNHLESASRWSTCEDAISMPSFKLSQQETFAHSRLDSRLHSLHFLIPQTKKTYHHLVSHRCMLCLLPILVDKSSAGQPPPATLGTFSGRPARSFCVLRPPRFSRLPPELPAPLLATLRWSVKK